MIILGIETTCDETGVGIVRDGREVLANVVASSADMHKKYGGIVPEVAAREQVKVMVPTLEEALRSAQCTHFDVDAIAVAHGPGLVGSLLIGVETAKTLAVVFNKPLIPVNHLVGHIYANWVERMGSWASKGSEGKNLPEFPLVALVVSGGHTDLILMKSHSDYKWLGGSRDDAAGEVFDKVARVLGLGYPGGPEVERIARNFQFPISNFQFPRPMIREDNFDFSFSGLKTAVVNLVTGDQRLEVSKDEVAYEFQKAVTDVLVKKTFKAAKKYGAKNIVVGGGVAANSEIRSRMSEIGHKSNIKIFFPTKGMSVDNGAMIATAAYYQKSSIEPLKLSANPGLYF